MHIKHSEKDAFGVGKWVFSLNPILKHSQTPLGLKVPVSHCDNIACFKESTTLITHKALSLVWLGQMLKGLLAALVPLQMLGQAQGRILRAGLQLWLQLQTPGC